MDYASSSSPDFSSDIIFEILSRLFCLRTLGTCKIVCKDWNQIAKESSFLLTYCNNTHNLHGYYLQDRKSGKYFQNFVSSVDQDQLGVDSSVKFWRDGGHTHIKIEASSKQGILCVVREKLGVGGRRSTRYYVCKPSTGQWQPLPNPKLIFSTSHVALLVLHSNPFLRYKIVRLSQDFLPNSRIDCYGYCCEIFYSETRAWQRVKDVVLPYGVLLVHKNHSVIIGGGLIYWLADDQHAIVFNHQDQTCHRFPLPNLKMMNQSINPWRLIEYQGKLGVVQRMQQGNAQVWRMDDSNNHKCWSLVKEVDLDSSILQMDTDLFSGVEHVFPFRTDFEPVQLRL